MRLVKLVKLVALSTMFWVTSYNVPEHTPTPEQEQCRVVLNRKAWTMSEISGLCKRLKRVYSP